MVVCLVEGMPMHPQMRQQQQQQQQRGRADSGSDSHDGERRTPDMPPGPAHPPGPYDREAMRAWPERLPPHYGPMPGKLTSTSNKSTQHGYPGRHSC